jgi:hypothetical protein
MKLTADEKEFIKEKEVEHDEMLKQLEEARRFKVDDFLIAYAHSNKYNGKKMELLVNSYGTPKKFKVVAADKHGIPYIKELDKNGKPGGRLISIVTNGDDYNYRNNNYGQDLKFEIDPDFADAIILDDTAEFKPAANHKLKADLFKEITEYNKTVKVPMQNTDEVLKYMLSLKVGDIIWKSNKSSLTVTKVTTNPISKSAPRWRGDETIVWATNNKGETKELCISSLKWTAVYSARPRTYKELKE